MKFNHRISSLLFGLLMVLGLAVPSLAQQSDPIGSAPASKFSLPKRDSHAPFDADYSAPALSYQPRGGGSFGGGGGRSFGGGGGGRSFGGAGSSTGSFGGGGRSFGGSSSSPRTSSSSGTSSFGRSGAMGSSGPTRSTSVGGSRYAPSGTHSFYYNGGYHYGYGYGGYSYGWMHPMWYMYTPFYPTFYYNQPYMDNMGYYHAGGFSLIHALGGLCCCPIIFIGIIYMLSKSFGGGKRIKYTSSN